MMSNGVKVCRMDGGYKFQPPSLKVISYMLLDQMYKNPAPNLNLYQSIQRVMEKLLDKVEDKIWGIEVPGIMIDLVLTLC